MRRVEAQAAEYLKLKKLINERTGLDFSDPKENRLQEALKQCMDNSPVGDLSELYIQMSAESKLGRQLFEKLITLLTTGETYFFRNRPHFVALEKYILPELLERNRGGNSLRIWSAGCSTGEEPYSIAMTVSRLLPETDLRDVLILGTDIDRRALATASEGVYTSYSFRGVTDEEKKAFFTLVSNGFRIKERFRRMVTFRIHNLKGNADPPVDCGSGCFDLIVCRNVVIYFDRETGRKLIDRFHGYLSEGGYLMVGHSEYSIETYKEFVTRAFPEAVVYQKAERYHRPKRKKFFFRPVSEMDRNVFELSLPPPLGKAGEKDGQVGGVQEEEKEGAVEEPFKEALLSFEKKEHDRAIGILMKILDGESDNVEAALLIGKISADRGSNRDAAVWLARVIELNPLNFEAYYLLSILQSQEEHYNEAENLLKKVIYLNPNFFMGYYQLGKVYQKMNENRKASGMFRNALSILTKRDPEEVVPGSDGITVMRLSRIIEKDLQRFHKEMKK